MAPAKTKPVTFYSKRTNLVLWLEPAQHAVVDTAGRQIQPASQGLKVEFEGGQFTTDDEKLLDRLREHRLFNSTFYEHGNAPDEPKPTVNQQLGAITRATAAGDLDAIEEVLKVEKDTHKRDVVLDAATDALEALEEAAKANTPTVDRAEAQAKAQTAPEKVVAAPEPSKDKEKAPSTSRRSEQS